MPTVGMGAVPTLMSLRNLSDPASVLEALFSSSPVPYVIFDLDGHIFATNAAYREMFGLDIPRDYSLFLDEIARRTGLTGTIQRAIAGETIHTGVVWYDANQLEHVHITDARRIAVKCTMFPLRDREGTVRHLAVAFREVTSEQQQAFLAELAGVLQRASEPGTTAAEVTRRLVEYLDVDRCAYAEMEGEETFAIIGEHTRGVPSIRGSYHAEVFGRTFARKMRANQPLVVDDVANDPRLDERARAAYTALNVRAMLAMPFQREGKLAGGMAVHQTRPRMWRTEEIELLRIVADRCWEALQRERAILDLREREEALREADRRKDEFLATLAHELRNPLAPIRTGVELLKGTSGGALADKATAVIERQLQHLVRLVDDLMDVSRVSRGTFELKRDRVRVRTIIDHAIEAVTPQIEAYGHVVQVIAPEEPLVVFGDLTRLAQIVSNLLDNAVKYTPRGGTITLSVEHTADQVFLRVRDTGIGIEPDQLTRVFDLFTQVGRTTHRAQGGLGIGLSLVRNLVEMHGGRVWAESAGRGQGTTFTVQLPLYVEAGRSAERASPVDVHEPHEGRRVLVVDDNVDAADTLAMLIEHDGHQTRTAHSGPEAVDVASEFHPDIVFLDLGLPGMNGWEVAQRLRGDPELESVVLVAVTGWGAEEDRRRSQQAGFDAHLTKPVAAATVRTFVDRLAPSRA